MGGRLQQGLLYCKRNACDKNTFLSFRLKAVSPNNQQNGICTKKKS